MSRSTSTKKQKKDLSEITEAEQEQIDSLLRDFTLGISPYTACFQHGIERPALMKLVAKLYEENRLLSQPVAGGSCTKKCKPKIKNPVVKKSVKKAAKKKAARKK